MGYSSSLVVQDFFHQQYEGIMQDLGHMLGKWRSCQLAPLPVPTSRPHPEAAVPRINAMNFPRKRTADCSFFLQNCSSLKVRCAILGTFGISTFIGSSTTLAATPQLGGSRWWCRDVVELMNGILEHHLGVSKNSGTPKWMVYNGKPY